MIGNCQQCLHEFFYFHCVKSTAFHFTTHILIQFKQRYFVLSVIFRSFESDGLVFEEYFRWS